MSYNSCIVIIFLCSQFAFYSEDLGQEINQPLFRNDTGPIAQRLQDDNGSSSNESTNDVRQKGESEYKIYDDWIRLIIQIMVGGALAGLGIFIGNLALDIHRRPRLVVIKEKTIPTSIDLNAFEISHPYYGDVSKFSIKYTVHRIGIKNKSSHPAEECKAGIRRDGVEEKLCWTIPQERYKMTINANSTEYVDFLGYIEDDPYEVFLDLQEAIERVDMRSRTHDKFLRETGERIVRKLRADYSSVEDIPKLISPNEHGWESTNVKLNRRQEPGEVELVVSSKNGRSVVVEKVVILSTMDLDGRLVRFA